MPPETSDREISGDLLGKERQGKKGKLSRKEGNQKKKKKEGGKLKMKGGKWLQNEERTFFFFFFFFHFSKRLEFVLDLPKWEFSTRRKHFMPAKESGKITLPPLKNNSLTPLIPAQIEYNTSHHTGNSKYSI